jgi:hypothetical protein
MPPNFAGTTPRVNLYVDGVLYGERHWSAIPSIGHDLLYKKGGAQHKALVKSVVWGGTNDFPIVDIFSETQSD